MQNQATIYSVKKALLPSGWASDVELEVNHLGDITKVRYGTKNTGSIELNGILLPGMPNLHSHAHQRAMVGLAEKAGDSKDSFWTWRKTMYAYLERIQPNQLQAIAAQLYVEMLKFGYTNVAEFQYLHHDVGGKAFSNPAEMSERCMHAAQEAGIGLTMLPVLYGYSGFGGQKPLAGQRRFINNPDQFLGIISQLQKFSKNDANTTIGIAPHSLRAVTQESLSLVLNCFSTGPIHIHIAEQIPEVEACLQWSGQRPVEWLLDHFPVDSRWCLIHATHLTEDEITNTIKSQAVVGICPTTEANLGDGIFPSSEYLSQGGLFGIGSDSQVCISPAEELRLLEYTQRLTKHSRNVLASGPSTSTGRSLFEQALVGGRQACGRKIGKIEQGYRADFILLDHDHPRLALHPEEALIDGWVFGCNENPIKDVFVGGKHVVSDYAHVSEEDITRNFINAFDELQKQ